MYNDQLSKRRFIAAFFDQAEKRMDFLTELARTGHEYEAMTLCMTYIDIFAQWLQWPSSKSGANFVEALIQFGGDRLMGLTHPLLASRVFKASAKPEWKMIGEKIEGAFIGRIGEVIPKPIFEHELTIHLTPEEFAKVHPNLWKSTIANIVYGHLRNPSVHNLVRVAPLFFPRPPTKAIHFLQLHLGNLRNAPPAL